MWLQFPENAVPPNSKGSKLEDIVVPDVENALQAPAFPAANDVTIPPPPLSKSRIIVLVFIMFSIFHANLHAD